MTSFLKDLKKSLYRENNFFELCVKFPFREVHLPTFDLTQNYTLTDVKLFTTYG